MKNKRIEIYVDGGARGNPGPAGVGVLILDGAGKKIKDVSKYIGEATNNIAEYSALVRALEEAELLSVSEIVIHTDSELMAKQLSGEYKVKNADISKELKLIYETFQKTKSILNLRLIKKIWRI